MSMEDWGAVRDRLRDYANGVAGPLDGLQVRADIRAALERVDHYESAFDRATEWIKKHLPDTPSGSLILDVLRQRVEELEAEVARLDGLILDWVDRYDKIEKSDEYRSVWEMSQIHQGPYRGEQWNDELNALRDEARRIRAQREECRHAGRQQGETPCPDCSAQREEGR